MSDEEFMRDIRKAHDDERAYGCSCYETESTAGVPAEQCDRSRMIEVYFRLLGTSDE